MDRLQIIVGDIFEMNADALIFPANPLPEVGGSLDRIVYEKAGWDSLLEARKEIGALKSTESKITKALSKRQPIPPITKTEPGDPALTFNV